MVKRERVPFFQWGPLNKQRSHPDSELYLDFLVPQLQSLLDFSSKFSCNKLYPSLWSWFHHSWLSLLTRKVFLILGILRMTYISNISAIILIQYFGGARSKGFAQLRNVSKCIRSSRNCFRMSRTCYGISSRYPRVLWLFFQPEEIIMKKNLLLLLEEIRKK